MGFFEETDAAKKNRSDPSWLNEAHHEPTAAYREIERMMSQLEVGPSSAGRGNRTPIPQRVLIRPPAPSRIPPMTSSWNGITPARKIITNG